MIYFTNVFTVIFYTGVWGGRGGGSRLIDEWEGKVVMRGWWGGWGGEGVGWKGKLLHVYMIHMPIPILLYYTSERERDHQCLKLSIYIVHRGEGDGSPPIFILLYQFLHHIKLAEREGGRGRWINHPPTPPSPAPPWLWPRGIKREKDMGRGRRGSGSERKRDHPYSWWGRGVLRGCKGIKHKQLHIFSCDQAAIWLVQSVCLSVRLSHLFHHVPIIISSWNFQELLPMTKVTSMQKVKVRGQGHRGQHPT